jgi:hypothetical protein
MPKEHFRTLSQTPVSWLIAAAMFAAPGARLPAQPILAAKSAAGSDIEASMVGEASMSGDVSSSDEPSMSGADLSTSTAPPEIPVYEQPPPPEDNLVWMPGYWAWGMVDHGGAPAQGARRGHYRLRIGSRAANQQVRRRGEELNECP